MTPSPAVTHALTTWSSPAGTTNHQGRANGICARLFKPSNSVSRSEANVSTRPQATPANHTKGITKRHRIRALLEVFECLLRNAIILYLTISSDTSVVYPTPREALHTQSYGTRAAVRVHIIK